MRKSIPYVVLLLLLGSVILVACGGSSQGTELPAVPTEYQGKTDPYTGDAAAISAGQQIFTTTCETCHGATGAGDGPAASALNPKPADLKDLVKTLSDDYMFWRISEGGAFAPFNSAMPAQKNNLTEEQIWQVISYIKTLSK
jgi:mono/diheme cytochrome c family protein